MAPGPEPAASTTGIDVDGGGVPSPVTRGSKSSSVPRSGSGTSNATVKRNGAAPAKPPPVAWPEARSRPSRPRRRKPTLPSCVREQPAIAVPVAIRSPAAGARRSTQRGAGKDRVDPGARVGDLGARRAACGRRKQQARRCESDRPSLHSTPPGARSPTDPTPVRLRAKRNNPMTAPPALHCHQLVKRYGDLVAVAGLDLEVRGRVFRAAGSEWRRQDDHGRDPRGAAGARLRQGRGAGRALARRLRRGCGGGSGSSFRRPFPEKLSVPR